MTATRDDILLELKVFLRTIQKPSRPVESIGDADSLVATGLIDSLAVVQIVTYLESKYGIDFAATGVDPERLASMSSIVDLIQESRA